MTGNTLIGWRCKVVVLAGILGCLFLTSCQSLPFGLDRDCNSPDGDGCNAPSKVCNSPTVQALAKDVDTLERHIEKYGSVVAQHPDVWGQSRLTKHREDFENEMYKELDKFQLTLQGSLARSDQAYAADAFALSSAAAAAGSKGKSSDGSSTTTLISNDSSLKLPSGATIVSDTDPNASGTTLVSKNKANFPSGPTVVSATKLKPGGGGGGSGGSGTGGSGSGGGGAPSALPDQSDTFAAFNNVTRTPTGTVTGPTYAFLGNGGITVEPEVYLSQKARYIDYLNQLRRNNEGDDTADSPGYALNLIRIPVSVLPGKCTDIGHGAEVTMTLTPHLSEELLPTSFRNFVLNDLVDQIAYPMTQFINNPDNSIYLDDSKSSGDLVYDVGDLFRFVDNQLGEMVYIIEAQYARNPSGSKADAEKLDAVLVRDRAYLRALRFRLTLQPLFARPEWNWVDKILDGEKIEHDFEFTLPKAIKGVWQDKVKQGKGSAAEIDTVTPYRSAYFARFRDNINAVRSAMSPSVLVPSSKSRRATLPFPPSQMTEVYGFDFTFQLAAEAFRGLLKERFIRPCPDSNQIYIHMPDIQGYLQEELSGVYKLLANPCNSELWHMYCTQELANAVRSHQQGRILEMRKGFRAALVTKGKEGPPEGASMREATIALAWATIVESALLTEQLIRDMRESAAAKGCPCPHPGWLPYFLPDPPMEARIAFNEYVRCRWPIHIFALDPVTQQQNISDTFSSRREMQLSMSLAFVSGKINARNMMRYARRIEFDMATIDLNNTQVGFSHGDDTFGWRFYPRFQTPDIESNATVFFRDLLWGGPNRNALLRQRRLEPGERECVAVVMMPSFVPYADLTVSGNWFKLTNPKSKVMDSEFAMRLSKSVKTIENCGPRVLDANCYRDGDLHCLLQKAKQLSIRLPFQTTAVQIPYENTLGGFGMFNAGVTDLAPELNGWYGSPSINPNQPTTIFLVGNHFSVHQTRVIAAGNEIKNTELLSRQVIKVVVPPFPNLVGNPSQKFVDIHLATPYGLTQHLLVPVCIAPCPVPCPCFPPCNAQSGQSANTQFQGPGVMVAPTTSAPPMPAPPSSDSQASPSHSTQPPPSSNAQAPTSNNAQPPGAKTQSDKGTKKMPNSPSGSANPSSSSVAQPESGRLLSGGVPDERRAVCVSGGPSQ